MLQVTHKTLLLHFRFRVVIGDSKIESEKNISFNVESENLVEDVILPSSNKSNAYEVNKSEEDLTYPENCNKTDNNIISTDQTELVEQDKDYEIHPSTSSYKDKHYENAGTYPSEDDDDSVRDPNYATESDCSESDTAMHTKVSHVVADADVQEGNLDKERIRPRKGRKRKHANVSRSGNKENRNSNRDYFNYKGKKIQAKTFIDFDCKCTMKCHDNVSLEIRKIEFERFWSLKSYDSQVTFIAAGVQQFPKKRLYGRDPDKRQFSRRYNIHGQIVCKSIYLKTLGITSFRVHTALKKFRGVIPITDQRGQKQGGYNKLADDKVQKVVDQINRIPKYTSHYRREATTAQFLPPDVTIQKMFEMYRLETENPVSFSSYKKISLHDNPHDNPDRSLHV
ncbi:uncharacterized protein LOC116166139 [Photinus pyralis]|uniref:uncharacterized protein LOC116166139 n=1 Tax=Photinus pyralis TaxID=7054 RepID=UPI00126766C3|nr:uncharacterized protein LOC116166139 [Photinus pyralis]